MIAIGSDHGGYTLKEVIKKHFIEKDIDFKDYGADSENSVDYPDYALKVIEALKNGEAKKAVLICGTGLGMSLAANKVPGIRAALCTDSFMARMSREHNDANVLVLGGRVIGSELAIDIVDTWIKTGFSGEERHQRRINKIRAIEKKYLK